MRVLLLSVDSEKSKGGVAEWTKQYKNACQQADLECDVVDTSAIGKIAAQITAKRNLMDEYHRFRRIRTDLKRSLERQPYDVAHFNTNIGFFGIIRDYYLAKLIREYRVPIVLHFHCDIPFWVNNPLIHFYMGRILKISSNAFVLNKTSQSYLKSEFQTNSTIIPNFVDDNQIIREKTISEQIKTCVFVGRVSFLKGIRELYEAAKAFPDVRFILAGEISEESKSLETPPNVELIGIKPHEDVIRLFDHADVFLLPSHTEGFSIALLEAMARGVPAIASEVGSNADMLENRGGVVVPLGKNEVWIDAINRIKSSAVRREMSEWSIQKVRKAYSSSQVMAKIKTTYRMSIDL